MDGLVVTASADNTARTWTVPELGGFKVKAVSIKADQVNYDGPCPVNITFTGEITVTGGSGRVLYSFVRSNGISGPIETLEFDSSGTKTVSSTWKVGGPSYPALSGSQYIHIHEPQDLRSEMAFFNIKCESLDLPPPKQVSPADGSVINSSSREIDLQWSPVEGATSYRISVNYFDSRKQKWLALGDVRIANSTSYKVIFNNASLGRWRVWSVDDKGRTSERSDWWEFQFSP
jgi:hypothetical protein